MDTHKKTRNVQKFPKTAFAFYIKLYRKLRAPSKTKFQNILVEATKSWLSLTESEKQKLNNQFKESQNKYKLQFLNQLKNAKPFMKLKDARLKQLDLNNSNLLNQEQEPPIEEIGFQISAGTNQTEKYYIEETVLTSEDGILTNFGNEQDPEDNNEIITEEINTDEQTARAFLVEPLPPTLKTGKDLFHMLNSLEEANSISWTKLQQSEKNQYSRAVHLLKKDYITKYKEYLESLTPRELFDYYNKAIF